jgi:hypothetical protein
MRRWPENWPESQKKFQNRGNKEKKFFGRRGTQIFKDFQHRKYISAVISGNLRPK